jgi:N6-L-threonylcarbamoyladenine synthase
MNDIDAVAVTYAPGLIGALLVGVSFAKGLCLPLDKPLIPVHHLAGHIASNYLAHPELKPPFLCLVASGGHSHIVEVLDYTKFRIIGRTRDDAAGECFDKAARVMGYPYPGGVHIDKAAKLGDSSAYILPKPRVAGSPYDFSFSGLKTSVVNLVHNSSQKNEEINRENLSASLQKTISEILTEKTISAAEHYGYSTVVLAGGVSANSGVRKAFETECAKRNFRLFMPPLSLCGDNAAMIACQGYYEFLAGKRADESLNAYATMSIEEN